MRFLLTRRGFPAIHWGNLIGLAELGRGTPQAGAVPASLLSRLLHGIVGSGVVAAPAGGAVVLAAFIEIDRAGTLNNREGTLHVVVGDFADQQRAAPADAFGVQVGVVLGHAQAGQGPDATLRPGEIADEVGKTRRPEVRGSRRIAADPEAVVRKPSGPEFVQDLTSRRGIVIQGHESLIRHSILLQSVLWFLGVQAAPG